MFQIAMIEDEEDTRQEVERLIFYLIYYKY